MSTSRNQLHMTKLGDFRAYCESCGWVAEQTKDVFEVLRMRRDGNRDPLLVYTRIGAKEHYTAHGIAQQMLIAFLRHSKQQRKCTVVDRFAVMNIRAEVADLGLPAVVLANVASMELIGESLQVGQTRFLTTRDSRERPALKATHRPISRVSVCASVAVLEADTSRESCRESSGTMEESAARRGDDVSACARLAHVTGSRTHSLCSGRTRRLRMRFVPVNWPGIQRCAQPVRFRTGNVVRLHHKLPTVG